MLTAVAATTGVRVGWGVGPRAVIGAMRDILGHVDLSTTEIYLTPDRDEVIAGVLAILMGLAFSGLLPIFTRDVRANWAPRAGLAAAPVLGLAFALGWTPCIGPALTVVLTLSADQKAAERWDDNGLYRIADVQAEILALGQQLFTGPAGCARCHGTNAQIASYTTNAITKIRVARGGRHSVGAARV